MIVLRIAFPLDVPVLEGPNDVRFIERSELDLNLLSTFRIGILKEQVKAATAGLDPLLLKKDQVAEPEDFWIFRNSKLHPLLIVLGMILKEDTLGFDIRRHNPARAT